MMIHNEVLYYKARGKDIYIFIEQLTNWWAHFLAGREADIHMVSKTEETW